MKHVLILIALLLASAPLGARQASGFDNSPLVVDGIYVDGELLVTVHARDIAVDQVVAAIAKKANLTLSGFDPNKRHPLVAIELDQRPLDMVLEFVLGSVGLEYDRAGANLEVHGHDKSRAALLDRAQIAYVRATTFFPKSPRAAAGRMAQGWIAQEKGDLMSALNFYQLVVQNYPDSPELPRAHLESGRVSEALGNWREASSSYDRLSELAIPHDFHAEQRLGRARCDIALAEPEAAIYKLKTLDLNIPAFDDAELAERILVRAQAHNAMRDYNTALIDLDQIDQLASPLIHAPEYLRATAIALEGLGLYGPAGNAWLAYSKKAKGGDRQAAVETSVDLFMQAGDEVNALFAVRFAESLGSTQKVALLKAQLFERLGLDQLEKEQDPNSTSQRLEKAQTAWDDGDVGAAYGQLGPLIQNLASLPDRERADAACLWAQCLDHLEGIESAVEFLRQAREIVHAMDNRSRLDLVAAELYENHDMFDEAVEAYSGIYR